MISNQNLIAFYTIVRREMVRFFRIWTQTLLPPVMTMWLYFVIFGSLIGAKVGMIEGFSYMQYIAPGLIMMSVITNTYGNVSASFFGNKFQHSIEELLIAPVPNYIILSGYVLGGVVRGILVAFLVTCLSLLFTHLPLHNALIVISMVLLASILFSLAGFLNALIARKFDDISFIPTFVITPLTYLGGVFFHLTMLSPIWYHVALMNPIAYMVSAFRYGFLGVTDVNITTAFVMVIICNILLYALNIYLLKRGIGLKN